MNSLQQKIFCHHLTSFQLNKIKFLFYLFMDMCNKNILLGMYEF